MYWLPVAKKIALYIGAANVTYGLVRLLIRHGGTGTLPPCDFANKLFTAVNLFSSDVYLSVIFQ